MTEEFGPFLSSLQDAYIAFEKRWHPIPRQTVPFDDEEVTIFRNMSALPGLVALADLIRRRRPW